LLRVAKRMRVLLFPGMLFEELGFSYFGPVDGHDVGRLVEVLENIKSLKGPVLLHIITKKGKGYEFAEQDPITWHGPGKFNLETGTLIKPTTPPPPAYQKVFGQALVKLAKTDPRIIAITAAMPEGTGTDLFRKEIPSRFYDVGLAEQHAVTFAAGMACDGLRPVCAIYSTFLQRGYDQLIHDVALQNLPVTFAIDRAGLVGPDGPTHAGSFDLSYLRCIPNMVVMTPADENECRQMLTTAFALHQPAAVRYPRGTGPGVPLQKGLSALPLGKADLLREGRGIALLAFGSVVQAALQAGEHLDATVVNMRFVKPLDEELVVQLAARHELVVTVEENAVMGGAGAAVGECLAAHGLTPALLHIGLPDHFVEQGSRNELLAECGLTAEGVLRQVAARRPHLAPVNPAATIDSY